MTQTATPTATDEATRREDSWVYFDGEFRRYRDAKIGLLTQGLNYGTGCFEGIRAYWSEQREQLYGFWFPEHYRRLHRNARTLQMKVPHSRPGALRLSPTSCSGATAPGRPPTSARPAFKSAEAIGFRLHDMPDSFAIVTAPMGDYVPTGGMRCMVSSWRRIDDNMAPPRTKCTGIYINSALAKSEALQAGFDEAVMLTASGSVCEGTGENIFIIREG